MDLKAAIIEEKGYVLRCADEETFEKVKRAIEKMDSEDFIIKAEQEGENIAVSLNATPKQLLTALGCIIQSMVGFAKISPFLISGIVNAALFKNKPTEGSEEDECGQALDWKETAE